MIATRKDGAELVNKFVREGRISPDVLYELNKVMLSERFHWTPEQIDEMKPYDRAVYSTVLGARGGEDGGTDTGAEG